MKTVFIAIFLLFSAGCGAATAGNVSDNLLVYAQAKSKGSMWAGSKSAYTKTFNVSIVNLTNNDIDLAAYCLRAYGPDSKSFGVDTADESLLKGSLKKGKTVSGTVEFSSDTPAVYQAAMVKFFTDCR